MSTQSAPATVRTQPAAAAVASETEKGPRKSVLARIPAPWLFASLITLILVVGEASAGILGGYERLPLALGTAMVLETILSRFLRGRWPHPISAYITGNSVAILMKPAAGLAWPLAVAAAISITSKYCLTVRGRHLWNPSNFGLSILLLIAPGSIAILSHEWGNQLPTFLIVFTVGMLVVWRARLLHISGTYAAAFVVLAALRSRLPGGDSFLIELAPITGPVYLLFIFFMITDPKTVVRGKKQQVLVTLVIALADCAIRVAGNNEVAWVQPFLPAPPLFALATVGPIALLVQLLRMPSKTKAAQAPHRGAPAPAS